MILELKVLAIALMGIGLSVQTSEPQSGFTFSQPSAQANYPDYQFSNISSNNQTSSAPAPRLSSVTYNFTGDSTLQLPSYDLNLGTVEIVPVQSAQLNVQL